MVHQTQNNPSSESYQQSLQKAFDQLQAAGFSVWGGIEGKKPFGKKWQKYAEEYPSESDINILFQQSVQHIGILLPWHTQDDQCLSKIGVIDCECEQTAKEFFEIMKEVAPGLTEKMHHRLNQRSCGEHFYFMYPPELVLPRVRIVDPEVPMKKRKGDNDVVLEVLGRENCKYVIVEAKGRKHVDGPDLTKMEPLTENEFKELCQVFEKIQERHSSKKKRKSSRIISCSNYDEKSANESFIEKFNRTFDVEKYLHSNGWKLDSEDNERWYFTRPDKAEGTSASLSKEKHIFYCFTTSTEFQAEVGYNPFQLYSCCEFNIDKGGDYAEAVALTKKQRAKKTHTSTLPDNRDLFLPGEGVSITECASNIFMEPYIQERMFLHGGNIVEIRTTDGFPRLYPVTPEAFCSRIDEIFNLKRYVCDRDGECNIKDTTCTISQAKTLMSARAADDYLPKIRGLSPIPVFTDTGRILTCGYDKPTGWLVTGTMEPYEMSHETGVEYLGGLIRDFQFTSESDRSRALAALITPAYRFAKFCKRVPMLWVEANDSQTGKGYLCECISALYGHTLSFSAKRNGGVGSIDEDISAKLISGSTMIVLDNLRGKLDSMMLESLLTADGTVSVRAAYSKNTEIDPSTVSFMATSNGVTLTRDQTNRVYTVRLRKQSAGYPFHCFSEGYLKEHILANRERYLGAVYAVLREWINCGKSLTNESRHPFREWTQCMDWIVQNLFKSAPLMDDYEEVKSRQSDPAMNFLRELAIWVLRERENMESLDDPKYYSASELYEICERRNIEIPSLQSNERASGIKILGVTLGKCFSERAADITVDDIKVCRTICQSRRDDKKGYRDVKKYTFEKIAPADCE